MRFRPIWFAASTTAFMFMAVPARSQVVVDSIGQAVGNSIQDRHERWRRQCISGQFEPPSPRLIAAAQQSAEETMRLYLSHASAAAPADVSAAFTRRPAARPWTANGESVTVSRVVDPLARMMPAGRIGPPSTFVRAIDGNSAVGVWQMMSAEGSTRLGHYRVLFLRESRSFKIATLELIEGAREPAPIEQYCFHVGDVEMFRASEERLRTHDPKRDLNLRVGSQ